jgi:hypothetical protein
MKTKRFPLSVAGLSLVVAFTFSCSDDKDDKNGSGICLEPQGIACYEGLTEAQCKMQQANEWKEGSCPSDWTKCPIEGGIINYFNPEVFSTCPELE